MANVTWERRYRQRTSGVYTRTMRDDPLGTWSTDQISRFYDQLTAFMTEERERTRAGVMDRSRIDTGLMRSEVEAFLSNTRSEIVLEFGWFDERPYYARYQEFGTSRGIEPMRAVGQEFAESFTRLKYELNR